MQLKFRHILITAIFVLGIVLAGTTTFNSDLLGAGSGTVNKLDVWKILSGNIVPRNDTYGIKIPYLASPDYCLTTDATGLVSTTTCAAAGGMTALPHTQIYVGNSSNVATATSSLTVLDNGYVGIGSTTPSTKLVVDGVITATGGNSTEWNVAYSWGDHALAGYSTVSQLTDLSDVSNANASEGRILIGDGLGTFASQAVSGDATLATNGALSVVKTGDWTGTLDSYEASALLDSKWVDAGTSLYPKGGESVSGAFFTATSTTASTFPYASTTAITVGTLYINGFPVTHTGSHSITLTTTGNTSVTLPTSGTIANTTSAMTGTFDGNNFAGGAIGTGQLLYGASAGSIQELSIGASSTVLTTAGTTPKWGSMYFSMISGLLNLATQVTGTLPASNIQDAYLLNNGDTGTGTYNFSGATVKQHTYPAFTYASSTAISQAEQVPIGTARNAQVFNTVQCYTDTGTLNVFISDGTNDTNSFTASTTAGTITFTSNNSFTSGEKRYVEFDTPASSPTTLSCSFDITVNN